MSPGLATALDPTFGLGTCMQRFNDIFSLRSIVVSLVHRHTDGGNYIEVGSNVFEFWRPLHSTVGFVVLQTDVINIRAFLYAIDAARRLIKAPRSITCKRTYGDQVGERIQEDLHRFQC